MTAFTTNGLDQLFALGCLVLIPFANSSRERMLACPLVAFFLGLRPDIRRDRDGIVLSQIEIGHARAGPELMRVFAPTHHPARIGFGADLQPARRDRGDFFLALYQMTAGATHLPEKSLTLGEPRHVLGEFLHVEM